MQQTTSPAQATQYSVCSRDPPSSNEVADSYFGSVAVSGSVVAGIKAEKAPTSSLSRNTEVGHLYKRVLLFQPHSQQPFGVPLNSVPVLSFQFSVLVLSISHLANDLTFEPAQRFENTMLKSTAATALVLAATKLASADLTVTVQLDATYIINSSRGPVCAGLRDLPTGTACPLKGNVAVADCRPELRTYNGTDCVAPVDAKCIAVGSTWSCVFPQVDLSSILTISRDSSIEKSPWGDLPWRAPPRVEQVSTRISAQTDLVATK
ncbi:unnamed protein product [Phytophthora fragariaefolia]|uniref:Unnamed protein product n=1 Tax=Phytophthora fragariaefolia TaxID=1490495 RepID=A0A9W6U0M0_9STRA|nr:unnamed protein product [Phytophthora fragariaefolia]